MMISLAVIEGVWSQRSIFPRKNPFSFSYVAHKRRPDACEDALDVRLFYQRSQDMFGDFPTTCARLIEDAEVPAPFASPRDGKLLKRIPNSLKVQPLAILLSDCFKAHSELSACAGACIQAASNSKKARGRCAHVHRHHRPYSCASSPSSP